MKFSPYQAQEFGSTVYVKVINETTYHLNGYHLAYRSDPDIRVVDNGYSTDHHRYELDVLGYLGFELLLDMDGAGDVDAFDMASYILEEESCGVFSRQGEPLGAVDLDRVEWITPTVVLLGFAWVPGETVMTSGQKCSCRDCTNHTYAGQFLGLCRSCAQELVEAALSPLEESSGLFLAYKNADARVCIEKRLQNEQAPGYLVVRAQQLQKMLQVRENLETLTCSPA